METTKTHLDPMGFSLTISEIARLLQRAAQPELKSRRLTVTQTRAFVYIARNEGCRQVDLAALLHLKPASLGNLIDRLEQSGLVRREVAHPDRRAVRLFLGQYAQSELEILAAISERQRQKALRGLTAQQSDALLGTLKQIKINLKRQMRA